MKNEQNNEECRTNKRTIKIWGDRVKIFQDKYLSYSLMWIIYDVLQTILNIPIYNTNPNILKHPTKDQNKMQLQKLLSY